MITLQSNTSSSKKIIVPHFILGSVNWIVIISLLCFHSELLFGHHFNNKLIAITHLVTLGWVTTIIFAALYQLIPVIFKSELYSQKLALVSLITLQIGTWLFFFSFWLNHTALPLILAAFILVISISIFGFNILKTILITKLKEIEKLSILSSIIWLFFTVIIGIILTINLSSPFLTISHLELLKVHAHFGIVGWFTQLIMGVSSVLFPMFLLTHNQSKRNIKFAFYLSNSALILGFLSIVLAKNSLGIIAYLLGATALIFFIQFIIQSFLKRIKKKIDISMKKSLFSFVWILIVLLLSSQVFLQFTEIKQWQINLYLSTFLLGFISNLIMGQTFKTLPFIVWLHNYKSNSTQANRMLPKDLYSHQLLKWQHFSYTAGLILIFPAILFANHVLLRIGFLSVLLASLLYLFNILKIITHKKQSS